MKNTIVDLDTKPCITIDLKPHLEAYCRMLFSCPVHQRKIFLTRKHHIGKLIFGHIFAADLKMGRPEMKNPITFVLPISCNEAGYWIKNGTSVSRHGAPS